MSASTATSDAFDLSTATIIEIQFALASGRLTAEELTEAYLARIHAYDKRGPAINAIITLNPQALDTARVLDAERNAGKVRSPLHGIPIVLKDNYDTFDLPTSAGSQLLAGSVPASDAFIVKKLREAGAIVVAKTNLSEFAGSGGSVFGATDAEVLSAGAVPCGFSSLGSQTRNPHDLARVPGGSSGGTGAAIAAAFAQFGLGTDTGGSIREPCSANGIAGLKPTMGLLSRTGIVPLALSLDTPGLMARNVGDVAIALSVMTGVDPADPVTQRCVGKVSVDYTKFLASGALNTARIGIARDFMGKDAGTDEAMEQAIVTLRKLGAVIVDPLRFPDFLLASRWSAYNVLVASEFKAQICDYLRTLQPGFPSSFDELLGKANDPATRYRSPQKAYALRYTASLALDLEDPRYIALRERMLAQTQAALDTILAAHRLDAIVYPTTPRPAAPIEPTGVMQPPSGTDSPALLANESGYPDLIVPMGMTSAGLPVTLSFLGPAFSEGRLIGYGHAFEQATQALRLPRHTPALSTDSIGKR